MSDNAQKPPAFIFGKRPETITASVKFQSITGAPVDIPCQFKYRTRKEFSELWDKLSKPVENHLAKPEDFSFANMAERGLQHAAASALEYLVAWPLDIDLNQESLVRLFDEEPVANAALWNAYRDAISEGRLGN